jgi:hypothetical protein
VIWMIYILLPGNARRADSIPQLSDLDVHVQDLRRIVQR